MNGVERRHLSELRKNRKKVSSRALLVPKKEKKSEK